MIKEDISNFEFMTHYILIFLLQASIFGYIFIKFPKSSYYSVLSG